MPILNTEKYQDLGSMGQLVSDIVFELLSWMVEEERQRIKTKQDLAKGLKISRNTIYKLKRELEESKL